MDIKKQWKYADFVQYVAKINIEYLEGRTTAENAMAAISAMIGKMNKDLKETN